MLKSINPHNNQLIQTYEETSDERLIINIKQAHEEYLKWRLSSFSTRISLFTELKFHLGKNKRKFADLMSMEMGKPIRAGISEIEKCALLCEYYIQHAEEFLQPEFIQAKTGTHTHQSYITYNPLGVILGIMPWNFPFWQVFRFAVPTIMAGNACLLKHASNVSGCSLAIEEIFKIAHFPVHLFQSVLVSSQRVEQLIAHPYIQGISLTGSVAAGRAVAQKAGYHLKKVVLELGGSDPYLILEDADLAHAAEQCVTARLLNSGQSCIAAKRFIVMKSVKEEFEQLCIEELKKYKLGNPQDWNTDLGPLHSLALKKELAQQVEQCVKLGAKVLWSGTPYGEPDHAYFPPILLTNIKPGMPAYSEELFGPVAAIIEANTEKEAIEIANSTSFGLGAAIFTQDIPKGEHLAKNELQSGLAFVNQFVRSNPGLPFGGIKHSGFGRELSHYGIKEFVNIKTVLMPINPLPT